ncbi:glutamate--cysteine ligase [Dactylosporangium sp. NPDC050588]|uniref:glutamate--cysteine ligase n=1 Tax=Dactylosporangium sp. NPDC050588 TaxID=3157211 RepID=UPI0033C340D6
MGKDVETTEFSREDRMRYRDKVRQCLDAFARMLSDAHFEDGDGMSGLEIELNLVDEHHDPALRNQRVLDALADPAFVTELGQFNIEINVPPRRLAGDGLAGFEQQVRASLNAAEEHAAGVDTRLAMIGILPTLRRDQLTPDVLSANPRYALLNEQIFAARGEDLLIAIDGVERLHVRCDSIAPEAACTSVQFHLQVSPQQFAAHWNAAQAVAGVQVALGANAPFLFGSELWRETRIPLFEQATDTRAEELKSQGVRPRVWFGERWITSIFDLFEENVRYFPSLLPICEDEDPIAVLDDGGVPKLGELRLHNGTVYRWNRPIYDVVDGKPHVRVENRVLPAGPTVVDSMANAAFYFGLVRRLAEQDRPVWTQMSFGAAEENFHSGARHGIDASLFWPGLGSVPVTELVLRRLLPMAREGLDGWGVDAAHRDRLLGIIEQRCLTARNGASWQVDTVHRITGAGQIDRDDTMRKLLEEYLPRMHSNVPVHEW